jgi:glycosyltransferase involved in cell wall biosynthesis
VGFNILHTEWSSGWGGQEMRIVAESVAMRARGHKMVIACQPDSQILREAKAAGIPTVPMRLRKGLDVAGIARCVQAIRAHGIDLVHTHSSPDAWTCGMAARLAGVRVIRSRHLSTPVKPGWTSRLVYGRLADRVITSGQAIRDHLIAINAMDPARIVSIPAGIDVQRFAPVADPLPARHELGFDDADFVIGIVAVLRSWKGHAHLIDAVHRLAAENVPVKLLIVGTGPQEEALKHKVSQLGMDSRVLMLGYRTDVPRLIGAMDCSVLPATKNEATSQALPQALAMKIPVIATAVGGLPEVVIDQQTGLLIPPGDADALCRALLWVHQHPAEAKQMAERGHAHVHAKFTFERMVDRTEAVYKSLCVPFL